MGKEIPTIEIEIGKGEDLKKVLLYQWLTQEEEDQYNAIMLGDLQISQEQMDAAARGELGFNVSLKKISESNKFLIESMCTTPWDQINSWKPSLRQELVSKIQEMRSKN